METLGDLKERVIKGALREARLTSPNPTGQMYESVWPIAVDVYYRIGVPASKPWPSRHICEIMDEMGVDRNDPRTLEAINAVASTGE